MKKRRRSTRLSRSTENAYTDLMIKGSEIAFASGQTIWHRTLMMPNADATALAALERREFSRMYTEKLQAAIDYSKIMTREIMRLNQQIAMMTWSQFLSTAVAMSSLATGEDPAGTFTAQRRFINSAGQCAGDASQKIAAAMTRAGIKGRTPLHTAVTANARRLDHRSPANVYRLS
jgi:hypothetical protein